jgi:hypothetical protein
MSCLRSASRVAVSISRISLAVTLAFALGAGAFVPASRVHAETKTGHQFTYYNNAAHQTVVGVWVYCSNGQSSHWGKVSPYDVISSSGC